MRISTLRLSLLFTLLLSATWAMSQNTYSTVGIIGTATPQGWDASTPMKLASSSDLHQWTLTLQLNQGEAKFRANNSWTVNWGSSGYPSGNGYQDGPNILVPATGYYTVTFNDVSGAYNFQALNPPVYNTIGVIGSATPVGWSASTAMTKSATDPHSWTLDAITLTQAEIKFRANNDWTDNWGSSSFPSGTAFKNGGNIPTTAGLYKVTFNDVTGDYYFESMYQTVGIIGSATANGWNASTPMVKGADNHTWTLNNITLTAGEAKFRANDSWDVSWGATAFPTGTAVLSNSSNIPITAGTYNITFNDQSGAYNFKAVNIPIVSLNPALPTADQPVTITYDATQGTSGLVGASKVYMHSGVVLSGTDGTTWNNTVGNWGQDNGVGAMTPVNNQPDKWQITLPGIRQYYSVENGVPVFRLAMVFRNADGTKTGKSADNGDIFVNINPGDYVQFTAPSATEVSAVSGQQIVISAEASSTANTLTLELDEGNGYNSVQQVSNNQTIGYNYTTGATNNLKMRVTAQIGSNTVTTQKTITINLRQPNTIAALPAGVKEGINYGGDCTSATLVLYAPNKTYVDVVGDFNNWQATNSYQMNKTPDGNYYWLTLSNLTPGTEYAFNYKVDDSIYIADPYTEKILDPDNDPFISSVTYPNLKPYPVNANVSPAKNGIMSVLQTCQPAYNWKVTNFAKPAKQNLMTYEMLVRDFGELHSYQMLIDTLSYFKRLGINAIELMPINEFTGNDSWGYNPTFYFALDKYYGTKDKLKEFIDSCHSNGIAIILDVVYNQMQADVAPQGKLYWDKINNRPAVNNPWLNMAAPHPYFPYQYDLNHESTATRYLVQRSMEYWLQEYRVDGFRIDAGKGFTQKCTQVNVQCPIAVGSIEDYDASRVNNLERYYDSIQLKYPNTYMIIEFLGQQRAEEQEYANHGFMLWGNNNPYYNQATMGYADNSNFSKVVYNSGEEAFSTPAEMGYMESHDEERLMFKNLAYGNSAGGYNVKDISTALQRQAAAAAVFFTVPGPKMLWQFGERGYDISIDDFGGRVSAKPPRWEYMQDANRLQLWNVYAKLIHFRLDNPTVFNSTAFNYNFYDNAGLVKWFGIQDPAAGGMKVMVVANFDVTPQTRTFTFQSAGIWYSYMSNGTGTGLNGGEGSSATLSSATQNITLQPGEYHVYIDRQYPYVAAPTFSPVAGRYNTAQSITLATITPGSTIHYTTDGTVPDATSPTYTAPLSITSNTTLKAIAIAAGITASSVAAATYNIEMYVKGTFNSYSNTAPMVMENGVWKVTGVSITAGNHEMKFANTTDWSGDDWGNATGTSGTAQLTTNGGPNITFTVANTGTYNITFNPVTLAYAITQEVIPCTLTASANAGTIKCNGGETTVTVTAQGGTAPYQGTGTFTVHAGDYAYTVTDAIGCTATVSGTVTEPVVLTAVATAGTIACNGGTTTITVSASGGTAPYKGTGTFIKGAGYYRFTVTDANGCTAKTTITLKQPAALTAAISNSNPQLYFGYSADKTSTIKVAPTGGVAPYKVSFTMNRPLQCNYVNNAGDEKWVPDAHTSTNANTACPVYPATATLAPVSTANGISVKGSYSIKVTLMADADITATVTDANGCVATSVTHISAEDVRCFSGKPGADKVTLCHQTGIASNPCVKMCVDTSEVNAHLAHGDYLGTCSANCTPTAAASGTSTVRTTDATSNTSSILRIKVLPNPTTTQFGLIVESSSKESVEVIVTDALGRKVYQTRGGTDKLYYFGGNFAAGTYFIRVLQGNNILMMKVVKAD